MMDERANRWMDGAWGRGTAQLVTGTETQKMIHGLILLEPIFFHFVETGLAASASADHVRL